MSKVIDDLSIISENINTIKSYKEKINDMTIQIQNIIKNCESYDDQIIYIEKLLVILPEKAKLKYKILLELKKSMFKYNKNIKDIDNLCLNLDIESLKYCNKNSENYLNMYLSLFDKKYLILIEILKWCERINVKRGFNIDNLEPNIKDFINSVIFNEGIKYLLSDVIFEEDLNILL